MQNTQSNTTTMIPLVDNNKQQDNIRSFFLQKEAE